MSSAALVLLTALGAFSATLDEGTSGEAVRGAETLTLDLDVAPRDDALVLLPRARLVERGPKLRLAEAPSSPVTEAPPLARARGISGESRVFWYAAGASALASLGARVIAFVPGLVAMVAIASMAIPFGPAVPMILFVALATGYAAVDAAIGALAGSLVFDRASSFYDSRYVAAFGGQFLGNALAVGVGSLLFGYGLMLLTGVNMLTEFIGTGVGIGFAFFSFFGFLPAVVVAFVASIAIPAMVGSWALAETASPRPGYVVDPTWDPFAMRRDVAPPRPRDREVALAPLALPFLTPLSLR